MASDYNPSFETRFKPGNPGGGRPKGSKSVLTKLKELMDATEIDGQKVPGGLTLGDLFARTIVQKAIKGDARFADMLMNRLHGRVSDAGEPAEERPKRIEVPDADPRYDPGGSGDAVGKSGWDPDNDPPEDGDPDEDAPEDPPGR